MNNKKDLMQKVITDLYHLYRYENCHRMDQALCAVLDAMEKYPTHKDIQITGRYVTITSIATCIVKYIILFKET